MKDIRDKKTIIIGKRTDKKRFKRYKEGKTEDTAGYLRRKSQI